MEDFKFYVPEITEFRVGFEYENIGPDFKFYKRIYGDNRDIPLLNSDEYLISSIEEDIEDGEIRVKYLDKEDIEELGFKFINEKSYSSTLMNNSREIVFHKLLNNEYKIIVNIGEYKETIFRGNIKNKSELKRLLKQLNIL